MLLFSNYFKSSNIVKDAIIERRSSRTNIYSSLLKFSVGDVLIVFFWVKGLLYRFEGICIAIKKKGLQSSNVSLILRNVILGVGIELTVSYFINRVIIYLYLIISERIFCINVQNYIMFVNV